MRVLAIASQKNGSGKTTLAAHLAVAAERAGIGPVVLVDLDPRGGLRNWWRDRDEDAPLLAHTDPSRLAADLEMLRRDGVRLAIVDTPPAVTPAVARAVAAADLILVPSRSSVHDPRAVTGTVGLCAIAGKPLLFVVNAAPLGAATPHEATIALSRHGTVAPVAVHQRTAYAAAMLDGCTATEHDADGPAAREIDGLLAYVVGRLERDFRRTVFVVPGARSHVPSRPHGGFGRRGLDG